MMRDHYLAPDIEAASRQVGAGHLARLLRGIAGLPALWVAQ
jgi:hypothetical protein